MLASINVCGNVLETLLQLDRNNRIHNDIPEPRQNTKERQNISEKYSKD